MGLYPPMVYPHVNPVTQILIGTIQVIVSHVKLGLQLLVILEEVTALHAKVIKLKLPRFDYSEGVVITPCKGKEVTYSRYFIVIEEYSE